MAAVVGPSIGPINKSASAKCKFQNMSAVSALIKKAVAEHPVVIFSKTYCPHCTRAKEIFRSLSAKSHVIELDERGNFERGFK